MEVVVEVATVRGVPGDRPTLDAACTPRSSQSARGRRDQRRVACVQVAQVAARLSITNVHARAAVIPARVEHEVVDDELTPALEQVEQPGLTFGAVEDVLLVDLDHRQLAALSVHRVALAGELLLMGQQLLAGHEPLVSRHDRVGQTS